MACQRSSFSASFTHHFRGDPRGPPHPWRQDLGVHILSDLTGQGVEGLDSPRWTPLVKPGMKPPPSEIREYLTELVPDPERLRCGRLQPGPSCGDWDALLLVDEAPGSQYDALLEAQRRLKTTPAAVAALALAGRQFHGNRGRAWQAVRGNLHLSCQLPVDLDAARSAPAVPAIAALAVCETIVALHPAAEPRIKWVNDVLLGPDKVSGVLASAQSRGARITSITYGIGLNVAVAPEVPPTVFVPGVTSLQGAGLPSPLGSVIETLLAVLWDHLRHLAEHGPERAVDGYRRFSADRGRRVAVYAEGLPDTNDPAALPAPVAEGLVTGLDPQLGLCVQGVAEPLSGGRLRYL